ncbi:uncharacterized protein HMPREF1541_10817 [Cyphellophora europaea CBS 101466]|uniref:Cyclin-dependent protein kinase regulator Pho80 n=1 Tax=Cyphellophora europaea (strain CBS 101466) TaxID=1220924 RepID=W2S6D7_CYPE1|nr:uncharacterized protein HMPREF1541_10817 [Cyphellophora europaea CBS 101466]ETN44266.1 hypothetical protein HMPREF1541_10817 [Cyphellophora europaea CBS 101466]
MLTRSPVSAPQPRHESGRYSFISRRTSTKSLDSFRPRRVTYVDRGVGASPPPRPSSPTRPSRQNPSTPLVDKAPRATQEQAIVKAESPPSSLEPARSIAHLAIKRHASDDFSADDEQMTDADAKSDVDDDSPTKKARADTPPRKVVPAQYEDCDVRDLVVLISSMILELISYNDAIPLRDGHLTRFHSRAPPGISVQDYLQRLTTHATLSPPILLSMVFYIDRLCALYPAFTITSLTVHRFLIASGTVASKGLSDSFWTNKTYARVGGVSIRELALLELEFLTRLEWRIVPKPEVLVDYYRSLVNRSETHRFEEPPTG